VEVQGLLFQKGVFPIKDDPNLLSTPDNYELQNHYISLENMFAGALKEKEQIEPVQMSGALSGGDLDFHFYKNPPL